MSSKWVKHLIVYENQTSPTSLTRARVFHWWKSFCQQLCPRVQSTFLFITFSPLVSLPLKLIYFPISPWSLPSPTVVSLCQQDPLIRKLFQWLDVSWLSNGGFTPDYQPSGTGMLERCNTLEATQNNLLTCAMIYPSLWSPKFFKKQTYKLLKNAAVKTNWVAALLEKYPTNFTNFNELVPASEQSFELAVSKTPRNTDKWSCIRPTSNTAVDSRNIWHIQQQYLIFCGTPSDCWTTWKW